MKVIAFYLPQYHNIPENDEWWGDGFTEWTNVRKAQPYFEGHNQPEIPLNENYYNLLDDKVKLWQAKLAKEYGVYGFCYYHYWFNGKMLLEQPMEQMLRNKEIEQHFCICWANEPWTKAWVNETKVLIPQKYGHEKEWKEHFDYLLPFFKDERYIKCSGRPLMVIYRPQVIDNIREMILYWNKLAKEAGFNKVVFIIRKDIFKEFEEIIGNRIKEQIDVEYVFQELDDLPEGFEVPEGRTKPWGTGQAVLCCKDVVKEPFVIINADDYYGKEAFVKLHDFLVSGEDLGREFTMGMGGFILKNTLSDNGTVTRGVSVVDENGLLSQVHETTGIEMGEDGQIKCDSEEVQKWISPEDKVSMNMWAGYPEFLDFLAEDFKDFLANVEEGDLKSEYLLPNIVDKLLKEERANVKVLETQDRWFGVTYKEDKETVQEAFRELIADGVYAEMLWE